MNCKEFIEFLMDYLEQQQPDRARAEFERHIADCPECLRYLDSYKTTVKLGQLACSDDESPPGGAPEKLVQAILAAVEKR